VINRRIFNHEHVAFRDSVRKWAAAELAPYSEPWRAQGMVPKSAWKKAGEQGYLCMWAGEAYGGAGYMEEYEICRLYADARISRIYAGTSEIMKEIIGRGLGLGERKRT
jgi:acyl-CoA dehydrogenase